MQISTFQRLARPVLHVALAFVAALVAALVVAVVVLPLTGHARSLSVLTGSMSPSIRAGSMVFIRPVAPRQIAVGDVITFHPRSDRDVLVTHRVVGAVFGTDPALSFRTRGDANSAEDLNLVPAGAVVGRVVYDLPYLGSLSARVRTPAGVLGLALAALFVVRVTPSRRRSQPSQPTLSLEQPAASSAGGGASHA